MAGWAVFLFLNNKTPVPSTSSLQKESISSPKGATQPQTSSPVSKPYFQPKAAPQRSDLPPLREKAKIDETAKQTFEPGKKQRFANPLIDITGATDEERNTIKSQLAELNLKAATINISKSERDNSRNVYIQVTYQDSTGFTDSFNTPLDNVASLILSEISNKRRQQ